MQVVDAFTQSDFHCIAFYIQYILCFSWESRQKPLSNRNGLIQFVRIMYAYNARFKGRFDLPLLQQDPVDLSEEGVDFDGFL